MESEKSASARNRAATASAASYSCSNIHISRNIITAGYYSGNTVIPSKAGVSAAGIEAQCILKNRGYYGDAVDGVFGPKSQAAMKWYQRDVNRYGAGLTVDGIPGPASWPWLRRADWSVP
jgi:peptidoglycan hydrolase-like protein with peptidoglycan-binding domain